MKQKRTLKFVLIGCAVVIVCLVFGFCGYLYWQTAVDEQTAARNIANRLGIQPDPATVTDYVYCQLIVLGEPKQKVEENLSKVGSYHSDQNNSFTSYTFDDPYIGPFLGEIQLDYDSNWVLIAKGKRVSLGDYQSFTCSYKQ